MFRFCLWDHCSTYYLWEWNTNGKAKAMTIRRHMLTCIEERKAIPLLYMWEDGCNMMTFTDGHGGYHVVCWYCDLTEVYRLPACESPVFPEGRCSFHESDFSVCVCVRQVPELEIRRRALVGKRGVSVSPCIPMQTLLLLLSSCL